jgi:enamine deaminase RidA (YjgF/YER057c/UK114 family)
MIVSQVQVHRLTVPDLFPPPGYAHVAVASVARLVVTAGAVPLDREGNLVGAGDYRAQARQTLDNLMREAGGGRREADARSRQSSDGEMVR